MPESRVTDWQTIENQVRMTASNARRVMDRATSEDALLRSIVDEAKLRGWLVHHSLPAQNRRGQWSTAIQGDRGLPDLILVCPPRVVFMEVKAERRKMSPEQDRWIDALDACWPGAEMYVIFPHDRDRITAIFEAVP